MKSSANHLSVDNTLHGLPLFVQENVEYLPMIFQKSQPL